MASNHNHISTDKTLDNSRLHHFFKDYILYKGDERLKYMISGMSGEHNPKNDD